MSFTIVLSCAVAILVVYVIHKTLSHQSHTHVQFSKPGIWFIYWPKWLLHAVSIKLWQLNLPKLVNNYDVKAWSYDRCGVVPSEADVKLESPMSLITDRHEDGILIWGGDETGKIVVAKVVRLSTRRASVFLMIKDAQQNVYTLPNQPDTNVINIENDNSWRGNGLLLECVEPMRTWRLKFNGLLRKGTRDHYITHDIDDDDDDDEADIVHARLDFLWKAMRAPVDTWRDASCRLLADALARETMVDYSSFRALERDGYDQWGVLHGTIKIGDDVPQTWYLRGGRQHRWGMSDSATNLQRMVSLFSYFDNGNILWIEAFSFNSGISHCVMGYVMTASGLFHPVTSSSLDLSDLEEKKGKKLTNVFVECKAGGARINLWNRLCGRVLVYTGDPWTLEHEIRPMSCASPTLGEGWGFSFWSKRFNGLCPVPEREALCLSPAPSVVLESTLVAPISEALCACVALSGGKGASLCHLKEIQKLTDDPELKFTVPDGVVITSHAWQKQTEASAELMQAISCLEKAVTSSHVIRIKEACQKIRLIIDDLQLCDEVYDCLRNKLHTLFPLEAVYRKTFAVRSSACGEDSAEASCAGQNESTLGCQWKDRGESEHQSTSILRAVIHCWGSQFSYTSIEYRRQRGQPVVGGMAVVVQEMVPATCAGVLFTRKPDTGSPASIAITATYGLGEGVVSGCVDPDTILVRRSWRNKLRVESKSVGEKRCKFVTKDTGGVERVSVSPAARQSLCFSEGAALRLARLGIHVEDHFGSPRDIEFALDQHGHLFLLQARPITSLDEWTDYDIRHELDSAFISDQEIHTVANVAEVFNGYICPLTASSVVKMLDISMQREFRQREWPSYHFDPNFQRNVVISNMNCLLNVGELLYRASEPEVTLVNNAVDLAVFGHLVTTQEILDWAIARFGLPSRFNKMTRAAYAFYDLLMNAGRVKASKATYSAFDIDTSRIVSSLHLYQEICRKIPQLSKIGECHIHTSAASSFTQCIALSFIAEGKAEITQPLIQDMASLLSCISRTESSDVPKSLKLLAKTIYDNDEVDDFLSMSPDEATVWLESHPDAVGEEFRLFLQKHGHRCIKEFDLRSLSWGLSSEGLATTLQVMVRHPNSFAATKDPKDLDQVLDNLHSAVKGSKRRVLKFILSLCGTSVSLREKTKSLLIRTVDAFRKAYRTLGQVMVSECRLPDPDLIFFLQHREIGTLIHTRSARLVSKAVRRRKLMTQLEGLNFPEICFGVPQPDTPERASAPSRPSRPCSPTSPSNRIRGTPVCCGIGTGPARVVTALQDAALIQNGDILVTFCTDVGWTPYFPLLAGVVTEIGGLISHGAVVAREYGLPCIVGAKGVTKMLMSGEMVVINGGEGFIQRVTPN